MMYHGMEKALLELLGIESKYVVRIQLDVQAWHLPILTVTEQFPSWKFKETKRYVQKWHPIAKDTTGSRCEKALQVLQAQINKDFGKLKKETKKAFLDSQAEIESWSRAPVRYRSRAPIRCCSCCKEADHD